MPVPPISGQAFTFYVFLPSQADPNIFQVNPTLAAGDIQTSVDGGAFANVLGAAVVPAGGRQVRIQLSGAQTTGDWVSVVASDQAGAEWQDQAWTFQTDTQQVGDLAATGADGDTLETLSDQIDLVPAAADTADAVWDEVCDDVTHFAADTAGEFVTIVRGLSQSNWVMDSTTYDASGFLTAGRIRIFPDRATALAATDGGVAEGEIATFTIGGTPEAIPNTGVQIGRVTRNP